MKYKVLFLAGSLALSAAPAWAVDYGTMLANTCVGCHGSEGGSAGPATPSIGGLGKDTFTEAMNGYKKGERPSTIMGRIAKAYTDEEIGLMADYFSKQTFHRPEQTVDAAKVAQGGKLHKEYCDKCHEDNGTKDVDGSSVLGGQWLPYLQYSLADFNDGKREMSNKMRKRLEAMVKDHGADSLDAIANFYASQK